MEFNKEADEKFGDQSLFSSATDVGKTAAVRDGEVEVDGRKLVTVKWIGASAEGPNKIAAVDDDIGGKVLLEDSDGHDTAFGNPDQYASALMHDINNKLLKPICTREGN